MKWNPYQDQENRAYSGILTSLFPEQTKTLPRILVWSVIFLIDLVLTVAVFFRYGLLGGKYNYLLLLAAVFGIFWLQGYLWGIFRKLRGEKE